MAPTQRDVEASFPRRALLVFGSGDGVDLGEEGLGVGRPVMSSYGPATSVNRSVAVWPTRSASPPPVARYATSAAGSKNRGDHGTEVGCPMSIGR